MLDLKVMVGGLNHHHLLQRSEVPNVYYRVYIHKVVSFVSCRFTKGTLIVLELLAHPMTQHTVSSQYYG